jgi:hypothetical protein
MRSEPLEPTASCERLASLVLPNATITLALVVDAGAFVLPRPAGAGPPPVDAAQSSSACLPFAEWPRR